MRVGNTRYWLFSDHLGSTAITANSSTGALIGELRYKAWGESRYSWGTTYTNRRYTGQLKESLLGGLEGLYYFNARWVDVYLNRWTSPDSIIPDQNDPQSWDRYAYVRNNPVNRIDPSGHKDCDEDGYCPQTTPTSPNDPSNPYFSAWRRLREGSPCTACHVTHWTGKIPDNSELDPELVDYYRSLDSIAAIVHSVVLVEASQLGNAAFAAQSTLDRALDLHNAIPSPIRQRMTTTAVLTTQEGVTLVGSSEAYINPAQRALLMPGEIEVMGQAGVHAEQKLVMAAQSTGLTPNTMLVSRYPVCPACQALLDYFNIPWTTP